MTAEQLIKILQGLPPETEILHHDDGDGGYGADQETPQVWYSKTKGKVVTATIGFEYSHCSDYRRLDA